MLWLSSQLRTVVFSPLPSYTSTFQSSKPTVLWVPSSCYVPAHDSQHRWCTALLQSRAQSLIWHDNMKRHDMTLHDVTYSNNIISGIIIEEAHDMELIDMCVMWLKRPTIAWYNAKIQCNNIQKDGTNRTVAYLLLYKSLDCIFMPSLVMN